MANKYYQKNKEKLRKEARERYQNLSEEEKEKRQKRLKTDIKIFPKKKKERQYHRDRNKNLSEEGKQKKVEYMRNYYLTHKIIFKVP